MSSFGLTYGVVLSLLGLGYLCAFIYQLGGVDLDGYKPAIAVGAFGMLVFAVALIRSIVGGDRPFFIPDGLVLMTMGMTYSIVAIFLVSDMRLVVLTRRELGSYFYSPVAYLVLLVTGLWAWIAYVYFWLQFEGNVVVPEPVVYILLGNWMTIIPVLFIIPGLDHAADQRRAHGNIRGPVTPPVSNANRREQAARESRVLHAHLVDVGVITLALRG